MNERYYYSLASGSTGNCGLYVCDGTAILIDLGISTRRIKTTLQNVDCDIRQLGGVLITHEHIDHIRGLETFVKHYDIPLYATRETAAAICARVPQAEEKLQSFWSGDAFSIGSLSVQSFPTPHDAAESVGYVIEGGGEKFGFATDLGFMPEAIKKRLSGCDTVVLESNHDPVMLETGPYPWSLKKRVRGARGHLSNPDCAACAATLAQQGTKTLILAHLSETNNTPKTALRETQQALSGLSVTCDIYVAPRDAMDAPVQLPSSEVYVQCSL